MFYNLVYEWMGFSSSGTEVSCDLMCPELSDDPKVGRKGR